MTSYEYFVKSTLDPESSAEIGQVLKLATRLQDFMAERADSIRLAQVHGAPSSAIQALVGALLVGELGFKHEVMFESNIGLSVRPRPDFVYRLSSGRGIIAEIERGGTTTNNHDLKDVWKAHISPSAHHLFLVVPHNNWKTDGTAREKVFPAVVRRVGAFFGDPRREVDIASAHIFGY